MKRHIRQTALVLLTAVLLVAGAFVTMIVGYAQEYYTVQIDYLFENGEKAHDPFIAVFEKGDADSPVIMDRTVTNPIIQGYKAVDSLDQDTQQPAPTFKLQGELTENREYKIYYVPVEVPYKVKYYLQNAYDDDYTESITLPGPYYNKMGLTGEKPGFPDELDSDENFSGFTRQSHDYEFIAADGSTEFEVYFNRNYYLINLDLNGGFGVDSVYAKYNTPFTIAKPQKEGYLFAGWAPCNKDGNFVDDQGNEISEDQAIKYADPFTSGVVPNEDRYYKAVWKAELVDYSIVYYALFKMNTVPYTLNYVYQGRRGGNNGNNYSGDDAEYDEKIYSVTVDLKPGAWTEDKTSFAQTLVDYAPDIDDLYKDCVWVINDSHVNVPVVCQFAAQLDCRCGLLCVLIQRINRFVALDNRVGDRLIHHHRLVGRLFKHGNIGVVCLCSVLKHIVDAYRIILLRVTDDHGDGCTGNQQNGSQQNKSSYYYEESIADSPHKINIPEYPVEALRRYYTFEGWYRSPLYVQKVDFDTYKMPDNDETFYAKWVPTKENVIFYNDYAAFENDKQLHNTTVPYNSLMLTEDIPTTQGQGHYKLTLPFSGARFSGWYYIDDTGTAVRFEPQILPVTRDLKLFAQWTSDLTAKYKVEYVEKGTDTPVADPLIGEAPVSSTKTFKAKANGDLNEAHRWKEGENNWWPVIQSHSLLIKPDESDNYYRFEYTQKGDVWYTVRYLDAATGDSLHDPVQKCSHNLLVTEQYLPIPHYLPDFTVKSQVIAASTKEKSDDAKAEELQTNVITFLYSKNDEQAYYQVDHKVLKNGGDPEKKDDYEQYRTESFVTEINHVLDFDTEVYGTPISTSLQNSGYHVVKKLTNVNGTQYNDTAELKVDGNNMVITVYYERQKYPYKVLYVDRNQESDYINGISDDKGILETHIFKDENQMQPVGAEVEINAPETLTVGEDHYTRVSQEKPVLTIRNEVYDHENPDPKLNVIKVYYEKERSVTLFYKVICDGAVEGDLVLSQNQEVIRKNDTAKGSTAMDESGVSGRYTFLGWFRTPAATDENNNRLTTADESFFKPDPVPANNTTYYALFKMNTVPYTLNYVYQGRRGGNNGNNYSGDDAEYDEKIYSVTVDLKPGAWTEDKTSFAQTLVDYAPDIDDLYKDCVWVINDSHVKRNARGLSHNDFRQSTCFI